MLMSAAGAAEEDVGLGRVHTQTFAVPPGHAVVYKCRVKKGDVGFVIREIREGQAPLDIRKSCRIRTDAQVQGEIKATTRARSIALVFDNKNLAVAKADSVKKIMGAAKDIGLLLKAKTVVYW